MTFTQQQIEALYPAEIHFDSVINKGCIRNAPQWLTERVISVYQAATGKKMNYKRGCSSCAFNIYKTVGAIYFEDLTALKKAQEEKPKKSRKKKCQETQTEETTA